MASRVAAASSPGVHAHLLRVVHQVPARVRLRPCAGRWTRRQKECVAAALRRTSGVQAFRMSNHSVVVEHSAPVQVVIDTIARAAHEPLAPRMQELAPQDAPVSSSRRRARWRLLACAVATLAIALLPEPAAPSLIALRLVAGAITALVRHQAELHASPCALTRFIERLEFAIGLVRADNLVRALCKHFAHALLKRWAENRLRHAFA